MQIEQLEKEKMQLAAELDAAKKEASAAKKEMMQRTGNFKQEYDRVLLRFAQEEGLRRHFEAESAKLRESTAEEAEKAEKAEKAREALQAQREADYKREIDNLKRELTSEREKRAQMESPPGAEAAEGASSSSSLERSSRRLSGSSSGSRQLPTAAAEDRPPAAVVASLASTVGSSLRPSVGRAPVSMAEASSEALAARQSPSQRLAIHGQAAAVTRRSAAGDRPPPSVVAGASLGHAPSSGSMHGGALGLSTQAFAAAVAVAAPVAAPQAASEAQGFGCDDADGMDEMPREGVGIIHESAPSSCILLRTPRVNPPAAAARHEGPEASEVAAPPGGPPLEVPPVSAKVLPMLRAAQPANGTRRVPATQQCRSRAGYWAMESRQEERLGALVPMLREMSFPLTTKVEAQMHREMSSPVTTASKVLEMAPRERSFPMAASGPLLTSPRLSMPSPEQSFTLVTPRCVGAPVPVPFSPRVGAPSRPLVTARQ